MLVTFSPVIPQIKNDAGDEGGLTGRKFIDRYREAKTIYENPLSKEADVSKFILEGEAGISFPNNRLRMQNKIDPSQKQKANFVYWCPVELPDRISITWDFYPLEEPGLCILFFSAKGINNEDIFDKSLKRRTGEYTQYHHGDINAYHLSYFRRNINERDFQLCNLRKSYGFYMVARGADPIPAVQFAKGPYKMRVVIYEGNIEFYINELPVLQWTDDGKTYGGILKGGKIGLRQMAPLVAEYANLKVTQIEKY
jgi:hypothetical protein